MKYELVAGLETHVELSTKTKIFCSCTTEFGGDQNTHCCPICIGLPGTLPKLNEKVVDYAIMAGLATNCEISEISKMDRKNYVYPDLPKAYQISQYDMPLCKNGYIQLSNGRKIRINRIHIEEDAGKLIHQMGDTFIDYNRGGVPLIEIVTEPDIRSVDEAKEYVEKLQLIMKHLEISDCKMQEGSMRCDVNISVKKEGSKEFGTRTEIKNMNSITFMTKAMEYEYKRQIEAIENGEEIYQETLRYDEKNNETLSMRGKEDANDYRYFREPDLVTIEVSKERIEKLQSILPESPDVKLKRYIEDFGLSELDASLLIKYKRISDFFDIASNGIKNKKIISNLILGQIFKHLENDEEKEKFDIKVSASQLKDLALLVDSGKVRLNLAKSVIDKMLETGKDAKEFISESDLSEISEEDIIELCNKAIELNEKAVNDYINGKEKALKSLVGFVMKSTKGRADALFTEKTLQKMLQN
mgnify:FL=1